MIIKKKLDVFIGVLGKVHDARCLRMSPFFQNRLNLMGDYFLLGDSAYLSRELNFILTPSRNVGNLTPEEERRNTKISRGRVIIENCFGSLKCKFRRLRDIQNTRPDIVVKIVLAACTLHNICLDTEYVCEDHPSDLFPGGCPLPIVDVNHDD